MSPGVRRHHLKKVIIQIPDCSGVQVYVPVNH